ncbi:MAG: type 1 glutamine amidotransferase [Ktedonobacteraceae bacterium]|nr:type 1 glutamine amidotransferase [Ktedonobacteraceae bacterium]
MKQVLLLLHSWEDPAGYVGTLLDERNIGYQVLNVETEPLPNPSNLAAIIAFGGPQHAYEEAKYPYFITEKAFLREVARQDIPYLGICLGGQLLAGALGGIVKRHTTTEIGFFDVYFTEMGLRDPLYQGLPEYQKVFHWHEDTFDLTPGSMLLATSQQTPNQAFRYGRRAYGLQYHIEVTPQMLHTWLHHPDFQDEILRTLGTEKIQKLEEEMLQHFALYQEHTRIMLDNFLKLSALC